jgi:hypothetical protein
MLPTYYCNTFNLTDCGQQKYYTYLVGIGSSLASAGEEDPLFDMPLLSSCPAF